VIDEFLTVLIPSAVSFNVMVGFVKPIRSCETTVRYTAELWRVVDCFGMYVSPHIFVTTFSAMYNVCGKLTAVRMKCFSRI